MKKKKEKMTGKEALEFLVLEHKGLNAHLKRLKQMIKVYKYEFEKSGNKKINLLSDIDDLEDDIKETELMIKNNEIMYFDLNLAISQGHDIVIEFGPWENN